MDPNDALEYLRKWRAPEFLALEFSIDLLLVLLFSWVLGLVYVRCGQTLAPRKQFARNFPLLAAATFVVISVVKSSLALSLGLVGALSIVRFRAAIKEPEEQVYLFLAITLGLGLGANQRLMTVIALAVVLVFLFSRHLLAKKDDGGNMHIRVSCDESVDQELLDPVVEVLKAHCDSVTLKRVDDGPGRFEAMFQVHFGTFERVKDCRKKLKEVHATLQVTLLEHQPLY